MPNTNTSLKTVTVYCPRGCNLLTVAEDDSDDTYDECGACGSIMRAEYREQFDDSIAYSTGEYLY